MIGRSDAQTLAGLCRKLGTLPEPEMHARGLARFLRETDAATAVGALELLSVTAQRPERATVQHAFVRLLCLMRPQMPALPGGPLPPIDATDVLPPDLACHLADVAVVEGARHIAYVLGVAFSGAPETAAKVILPGQLEDIPLGERKARARRPDPDRFKPLLVDPTPSVVDLLMDNARLTEDDVLRTTTLRPTHPFALVAVASKWRWLGRPRVLASLLLNPRTPTWLVGAMAPLATEAMLADTLRCAHFGPELREVLLHVQRGRRIGAVPRPLRVVERADAARDEKG